jgi:hypothetical protein
MEPTPQPMKSHQDHYAECYVTLARLVHALTAPDAEDRRLATLRDALEYVVRHCAFCGQPSDQEALRHGVIKTFVCEACYVAPVQLESARRTLRDPAVAALARHAHARLHGRAAPEIPTPARPRPKLCAVG